MNLLLFVEEQSWLWDGQTMLYHMFRQKTANIKKSVVLILEWSINLGGFIQKFDLICVLCRKSESYWRYSSH